jgi:hypothetical protein
MPPGAIPIAPGDAIMPGEARAPPIGIEPSATIGDAPGSGDPAAS